MYLFDTKETSCFFAGDTALMADTHQNGGGAICLRRTASSIIALLPIGHRAGVEAQRHSGRDT